jgi:hypothetical protein
MIFVIGPNFLLGHLDALALLFPCLDRWLQGQHAKLLRQPTERQEKVALAAPPPAQDPGITPAQPLL